MVPVKMIATTVVNRTMFDLTYKSVISVALGIALSWLFVILSTAEPSFYYSLVAKIGVLQDQQGRLAQYANVTYCDKTVSVTANHVSKEIVSIRPTAKLITVSEEYDIAIYEVLGNAVASPLAAVPPGPFDEVYVPTYVWMGNYVVVLKYLVVGYDTKLTLIQGMLFFGASGSGVYNKDGEYVGPILSIQGGPGFDRNITQQVGISGVGRTDKLVELFDGDVCSK